ncbi:MAG: hypothetical protein PHV43_01255, partial [Candidatus Colwellbacteria bacterium]|nr:hypothetical protein [Candidatus Colwellbacteria bacterium]
LGVIRHRAVYYNPDRGIADKEKTKDYWSEQRGAPWQWKLVEILNHTLSFFIAGLIGYYFVLVRLDPILRGSEMLNTNDIILFFIFALCIFGWFPYLLKNITEGISALIARVLERNK